MSGRLLPAEGDAAPLVVAPPLEGLGQDITANATCRAHFVNPPHQEHVARPLPDQGFEVRANPSAPQVRCSSLLSTSAQLQGCVTRTNTMRISLHAYLISVRNAGRLSELTMLPEGLHA